MPVDEVITLTLFYREDDQLRRLMLDPAEATRLDRLWTELHFVSQDALTMVDAFQQLLEYASQDADPKIFLPMRKPINDRAAAFRRELLSAEPIHLECSDCTGGACLPPAALCRRRGRNPRTLSKAAQRADSP